MQKKQENSQEEQLRHQVDQLNAMPRESLLEEMTLNREEEEKVNVIQYQPYEDHEYSDISSIVKHPVTGGRLFLGNIFSATDNLILEFYNFI